jgi:predicted secreted protein
MSYQYGKDWRVQVGDTAEPPVWTNIGGEGKFDKKSSPDKIDFTTKDDSGVKAMGFGLTSIDLSVDGNLKVPDAGLTKIQTATKASPAQAPIRIIGPGAVVKFQCLMAVAPLDISGDDKGAVTFSLALTAMAAPTVDDLMATV